MREWLLQQEDGGVIIVPGGLAAAAADAAPPSATPRRRRSRRRRRRARRVAVPRGKNVRRAARTSRRARCSSGRAAAAAGRSGRGGRRRAGLAAGRPAAGGRDHPDRRRDPAAGIDRAAGGNPRHELADDRRPVSSAQRGAAAERDPAGQPGHAGGRDSPLCPGRRPGAGNRPGSSRGRGDHTAAVLAQVGGIAVTGVAIRPGHPALLGHAKHPGHAAPAPAVRQAGVAPVIGLPGYPLATMVIFELFAAPLLAALQGVRQPTRAAPLLTARGHLRPASRSGCW